eukprot:6085090-Pleurochrysis_carterae.AAC.2
MGMRHERACADAAAAHGGAEKEAHVALSTAVRSEATGPILHAAAGEEARRTLAIRSCSSLPWSGPERRVKAYAAKAQ